MSIVARFQCRACGKYSNSSLEAEFCCDRVALVYVCTVCRAHFTEEAQLAAERCCQKGEESDMDGGFSEGELKEIVAEGRVKALPEVVEHLTRRVDALEVRQPKEQSLKNGDLKALQIALYEWARRTFQYGDDPVRVILAHFRKELDEIIVQPNEIVELGDGLMVLLNAISYSPYSFEEVLAAAWAKFAVVQEREWGEPDPQTGVIEHKRLEGKKIQAAERIAACVKACEGIDTRALQFGVIQQLLDACEEARCFIDAYRTTERDRELLRSRLELVASKARGV